MAAYWTQKEVTSDIERIALAVVAFIALIACGTFGYYFIEDWTVFDGLYMTVITLSTVGFHEVHELSPAGRVFTMFLIVIGVGIVASLFAWGAQLIVAKQFNLIFRRGRMEQKISNLSKHTIVCGYGRLGISTVEALLQAGESFVIVERDPERVRRALSAGLFVVEGDATSEQALLNAGLQRAKCLTALLPRDSDNLFVILTAKQLNNSLRMISRAEDETGERHLRNAGAHRVIAPYRTGGQRVADAVVRPNVADFIDLAAWDKREEFEIDELRVPINSKLAGIKIADTDIRRKANIMIAAVITEAGKMIFNPSADFVIEPGCTLIALGAKSDLSEFSKSL